MGFFLGRGHSAKASCEGPSIRGQFFGARGKRSGTNRLSTKKRGEGEMQMTKKIERRVKRWKDKKELLLIGKAQKISEAARRVFF